MSTNCRLAGIIRETCAAQTLRRAARKVSRRYDAALADLNLTIGQFSVLAALWGQEPMRLGALAEGLGMDRTTLTRNLRPLQKRGLVSFRTDRRDARARALSLTQAGGDLIRRAAQSWQKAQEGALAQLSAEEWKRLQSDLERLA